MLVVFSSTCLAENTYSETGYPAPPGIYGQAEILEKTLLDVDNIAPYRPVDAEQKMADDVSPASPVKPTIYESQVNNLLNQPAQQSAMPVFRPMTESAYPLTSETTPTSAPSLTPALPTSTHAMNGSADDAMNMSQSPVTGYQTDSSFNSPQYPSPDYPSDRQINNAQQLMPDHLPGNDLHVTRQSGYDYPQAPVYAQQTQQAGQLPFSQWGDMPVNGTDFSYGQQPQPPAPFIDRGYTQQYDYPQPVDGYAAEQEPHYFNFTGNNMGMPFENIRGPQNMHSGQFDFYGLNPGDFINRFMGTRGQDMWMPPSSPHLQALDHFPVPQNIYGMSPASQPEPMMQGNNYQFMPRVPEEEIIYPPSYPVGY